MRLCIISNSHAASLKLGWDRIAPRFPDTELYFYAAASDCLEKIDVDDGARYLYPTDRKTRNRLNEVTGGKPRLYPGEHDAFLLYGLRFILPRLNHGLPQDQIAAAANEALEQSIAWSLIGKLRQITDRPAFLGAEPLLALPTNWAQAARLARRRPCAGHTVAEAVAPRLAEQRVTLIQQPPDTIVRAFFTNARYSRGSARLAPARGLGNDLHEPQDRRHMNADYGAHYLETAIPLIGAAVEAAAEADRRA